MVWVAVVSPLGKWFESFDSVDAASAYLSQVLSSPGNKGAILGTNNHRRS